MGTVTNIDDVTQTLGGTVKVLVNALVVNPPECDKLELAPGESTYCTNLAGPITTIKPQNVEGTVRIQLNFVSERIFEVVECEEAE